MLNEERIMKSMTRSYFEMLGTLSQSNSGMEILTKNQVFDYLIPLSQLEGRHDLCTITIETLDYNSHGPCRLVLEKALKAPSHIVRYLATKRLQYLMRSGVSDFDEWGITRLVKMLNDENQRVSSFALGILSEAVCDSKNLTSLITKKPIDTLINMGKGGKELLIRFLSLSSGFSVVSKTFF